MLVIMMVEVEDLKSLASILWRFLLQLRMLLASFGHNVMRPEPGRIAESFIQIMNKKETTFKLPGLPTFIFVVKAQ